VSRTDQGWSVPEPQALGAAFGQASLHIAERAVCSSLLEVNARTIEMVPEAKVVGSAPVAITTLSKVWSDWLNADSRVLIKLDLQGMELEALRGLDPWPEALELIEIEVSCTELYRGQPSAGKLIGHIERRGGRVCALRPTLYEPRSWELMQFDALFAL